MKICVCSICKNEKTFLHRWYDSVKEADYVCLLDTGSTDGTYEEICRLPIIHRQEVIDPWHFGNARTVSFSLVPEDTDYCLFVDLDEYLEKNWRNELEQFLMNNSCNAATVVNINIVDGNVNHKDNKAIIFRYHQNLEWRYAVLEELFYNGLPILKYEDCHDGVKNTSIQLYHTRIDKPSRQKYTELNSTRVEEILIDLALENDDICKLYLCYAMLDSFMDQNKIDRSNIPYIYVKRLLESLNGIDIHRLCMSEQIIRLWCMFYFYMHVGDIDNAERISKMLIPYNTNRLLESLYMLFDYCLNKDYHKALHYGNMLFNLLNSYKVRTLIELYYIHDFLIKYVSICSSDVKDNLNNVLRMVASKIEDQTSFEEFIVNYR